MEKEKNMKNKKLISILLASAMALNIAACSSEDTSSDYSEDERVTTTAADDEEETSEETSETTTEAEDTTETTLREPDGPVESEFFTDFENMSFTYNGNTYTLGVTTLQDLIDDGIDLSGTDNLDEVVDGQSTFYAGFSFDLIPYRSATVTVANYTDEEMTASECTITSIKVSSLREIPEGTIEFNFPDMFTKEDLINCAGEPETQSEFDNNGVLTETLSYQQSSEIYYGYRTYSYTFEDGIIDTVSMSYIP